MRLIIKDYLLHLKEKDELDLLLCDLLLQMGYATDSKPKSGNRQYGVDIRAHNSKEILLCVVKQGNMDRRVWDADSNAVRQSLDEIQDVYIDFIKNDLQGKKLHIAVISNGVIEEAVSPNWTSYIKHNTSWQSIPVKIEFWDIDALVIAVQKHLLNEHIFNERMRSLLRKALYFIDESDYHKKHFENIVDDFLDSLDCEGKAKNQEKKLAGLYLASQMIAHYAAESKIYKIAVMVTEYLLIQYWKFLLVHSLFEKGRYAQWLCKFIKAYGKWGKEYYTITKSCAEGPNRFPSYNSVEQRVLLYEVLGYWASYAYWISFLGEYSQTAQKNCQQICDSIVGLANNYPQLFYPPYDRHIGPISMVLRLFMRVGRNGDVCTLIRRVSETTVHNYWLHNRYPAPDDSYETAVNISLGLPVSKYQCSAFLGTMLEWIVLMEQKELYESILPVLKDDLKDVTKCVWFLRSDEESSFYDYGAMNLVGEGTAFSIEDSFEQMERIVKFVLKQYEKEQFSYEQYSFQALEFIVCRYYGHLPRVLLETKETE